VKNWKNSYAVKKERQIRMCEGSRKENLNAKGTSRKKFVMRQEKG